MDQLNDLPRQKLREIVASYGRGVSNDPRRCRGLLMDLCGDYRREVNLLASVVEEPGAIDLLEASSMPPAMQVAQVTKRLHENRGLAEEFARWSVISWSLALGLIGEDTARLLDAQTVGSAPPASAPAPSYPPQAPGQWQPPASAAPLYPPQTGSQWQPSTSTPPSYPPQTYGQGSMGLSASSGQMGTIIVTYREHTNGVTCLAWSPDGQRIVSSDIIKGEQVWQPLLGRVICTLNHGGYSNATNGIAWSPDSKQVATAGNDKQVHLWNTDNGQLITTYAGHQKGVMDVSWSSDGERIASISDRFVHIWSPVSRECILTFTGPKTSLGAARVVVWSPDSTRIASCTSFGRVQVWNPNDGSEIYMYKEQLNSIEAMAWSFDSQRIASGGYEKTVQVWEAETGSYRVICRGHTKQINAVAFSPDGRFVASASSDSTVRIWNSESGQHIFTFNGHTKKVNALAWSLDGKYIASASDDKLVYVWASS